MAFREATRADSGGTWPSAARLGLTLLCAPARFTGTLAMADKSNRPRKPARESLRKPPTTHV